MDTLRDCIFAPAKRSYPTSKVRGSGREYQTATAQERPRGATLHLRSGGCREEIPSVRGQGWQREELLHFRGRGGGREGLPHAPKPEARGSGPEGQPHVQEAVAARVQEGLEELSHIEGQEGWR